MPSPTPFHLVIDQKSLTSVQLSIRMYGTQAVNRAVRQGVGIITRNGAQRLKAALMDHRRTGAYYRAVGSRVKTYRNGVVGIIGARGNMSVLDPIFGKVTPTKYAHLEEGGRKEVKPLRALALRIKVKKFDPAKRARKNATRIEGGYQYLERPTPKPRSVGNRRTRNKGPKKKTAPRVRRTRVTKRYFNKLWVQGKKVGGGWAFYSMYAAPAMPHRSLARVRFYLAQTMQRQLLGYMQGQVPHIAQSIRNRRVAGRLADVAFDF